MSDHIEAIARTISGDDEPDADELAWATEAWAAAIEELIAHQLCNGTNERTVTLLSVNLAGEQHQKPMGTEPCPGPHTVIDKGDGTKLYADNVGVGGRFPVRELIDALRHRGAWPTGWRVEPLPTCSHGSTRPHQVGGKTGFHYDAEFGCPEWETNGRGLFAGRLVGESNE